MPVPPEHPDYRYRPDRLVRPEHSDKSGTASVSENRRQVQLLLALADDSGWVSESWIFKNVEGYAHVTEESRARYLRADTAALLAAGVPVEVSSSSTNDKPKRLRLNRQRWAQENPNFTEQEASVVFQAANAAFSSEDLGATAVAAWQKLASFARRATIAKPDESVVVADPIDMGRGDFSTLLAAMTQPRHTVELWYARQYGVDDELRELEPWGLINLRGRFYVLGFDPQRGAPRMFRLSRVRDVSDTGTSATQPLPSGDLQQIAEEMLHRGDELHPAIVRIRPGTCGDVVMRATSLGENRYQLPPSTLRDIVSTGLSFAPDLVVESPLEARSEVITKLQQVLALHGASEPSVSERGASSVQSSTPSTGKEGQ